MNIQEGQRVYRVKWRNKQPFIEHAKAVWATKAHKSIKAELPTGERDTIYGWHVSIKNAVQSEICECGFEYGNKWLWPVWQKQYPPNPMALLNTISELGRLRRKLIKHGLW